MWMRRIGVPPIWPSRIKVVIMCVLYTAFLQQFFAYLVGGGANYVDLRRPGDPYARDADPHTIVRRCGLPGSCRAGVGALECFKSNISQGYSAVQIDQALPGICAIPAARCVEVSVPLTAYQTEFEGLYTNRNDREFNPFSAWAILYFFIMFLMVCSITVHDLILLHPYWRPHIRTRLEFKQDFARLNCLINSLLLRPLLHRIRVKACWLWVMLLPIWSVWMLVIFTVLLYPIVLCFYLWWPRSLARIMVFYTAALCFCWSLLFVLYMAIMARHDLFTIFWTQHYDDADCVCYCQYPLRGSVIIRVILLAAMACAASFGIAFRALKGLRQASWASLFSVTYTVPIEVFPTRWEAHETVENVDVEAPEGVASLGIKFSDTTSQSAQVPCVVEHLEEGSWAERVGILQGDELVEVDKQSVDIADFSNLHAQGQRPLVLRFLRRSGGGPIRFRKDGEEVQGEPAFDPFCLMDEQPESALTTVKLVPCDMTVHQRRRWRPDVQDLEEVCADIGGCGFPRWQRKVSCHSSRKLDGQDEAALRGGRLPYSQTEQPAMAFSEAAPHRAAAVTPQLFGNQLPAETETGPIKDEKHSSVADAPLS